MAKICVLLPRHWYSSKGGAEFQAHIFADHLARTTNHDILYLTKHPPSDREKLNYAIGQFGGPFSQKFGMVWDSRSLYRALSEFRPDVIVQRIACAYTGAAALYCQLHNAKLVWHISSDRDAANAPELPIGRLAGSIDVSLFKYGVRRATAIVAQTESQAIDLAANYGRSATKVIPNFADVPERTSQKSEKFTVLWIANLKPLKRPEIFIRIARELAQHDIAFKMIGRRAATAWCDSLLREISHESNIQYLGELELDQVNTELERAHLLINTSTYEGLPNTFIQSWMREVPTVTLSIDPDGMISAAGLGYCASDVEALKARVVQYFNDPRGLAEIGARARAFAMTRFSMKNVQVLQQLVEHVLDSGNGTSTAGK